MVKELKEEQEVPVRFSQRASVSIAGVLGGVIMAMGVPWVVLSCGQILGHGVLTTLCIIAIVLGGTVSLASAFFGLVMPSQIGEFGRQGLDIADRALELRKKKRSILQK